MKPVDYLEAATRWNNLTPQQREKFLEPALRESNENLATYRKQGVFCEITYNVKVLGLGPLQRIRVRERTADSMSFTITPKLVHRMTMKKVKKEIRKAWQDQKAPLRVVWTQ